MQLQEFAKMGKSFIVQLVGVQINFKSTSYIEKIDSNLCKSLDCPLYLESLKSNNPDTKILKMCQDKCKKTLVKVPITEYINENNKYKIPKVEQRLSKSQIKQLLLYHFLNVDKNGIVKNISTSEIADILGCSTKTIKNNNIRFAELNYIFLSHIDNDKFNILIKDYKRYHLTAQQGGSGYLHMPKNLFNKVLQESNVNCLRLELIKLLRFDEQNIGIIEPKPASISYGDIKRYLPKYLRYDAALKPIIFNPNSAFQSFDKKNAVEVIIEHKYNPNLLKLQLEKDYIIAFKSILNESNIIIDSKYFSDLVQMSFQYSHEIVKSAITYVIEKYSKKINTMDNFGGLVREIIEKIFISKSIA